MARRKKGTFEITIQGNKFPFEGHSIIEGKSYSVKNTIVGQTVKAKVIRNKKEKASGKLVEIIEKADFEIDSRCIHFPKCGGCLLQSVEYNKQLELTEEQVLNLFKENEISGFEYEGIIESPDKYNYRNKMEYSFGNEFKGGQLTLGLHPRGRIYDIIDTFECNIAPKDFNKIQKITKDFFLEKDIPYYRKNIHEGYLRHLVLRKGMKTGEIIIGLVTTSQIEYNLKDYANGLLDLKLDGNIVGIMHITNDKLSDAVIPEKTEILYGKDYYMDEILNLKFKVSLFSFFQTNPIGAEVLYSKAISYISDITDKVVYDLFSGTGTIGQIVSKKAKQVYGIELIEDAVSSANENMKLNEIDNCMFIAGDVFEKLDEIEEKPDVIILDPPRVGVDVKALDKIIKYKVDEIIYISCNPKAFVKNVKQLEEEGYKVDKLCLIDMFPHTAHVEVVTLLVKA